ncbi:MAG TPA: calcium-binding protein [Allosphingosinicella sp.]|nr:calcium-binding protein [Allosphingosinicella sp.]
MAEEFDPLRYIASYPDLIQAFGADAEAGRRHWLTYGQAEGRNPFLFNPFMYGASHPDLVGAFGTNYAAYTTHYVQHGFAEGRAPSSFDYLGYSASNADLLVVYGTDPTALARHYLEFGYKEGRSFSRVDGLIYGASNPDVAAAYGDNRADLLRHYINHGFYEHRPTTGFDSVQYVAANRDLLQFGYLNFPAEALRHYLTTGADESRPRDFDERAYLLSYSDLAAAHLGTADALNHWVTVGVGQGRAGDALYGHDQRSHALPATGALAAFDRPNDRDWFEVDLASGIGIVLVVTGPNGESVPARVTLHDQFGVRLAGDSLVPGEDVTSLDHFTTLSGRHYISVESAQTGAYKLQLTQGWATLNLNGRNYADPDFQGLQKTRYLLIADTFETQLGANAQAAGIRIVTATDPGASVTDASAYTTGLTVNVHAGGDDVVRTGSGNDLVNIGEGAQTISLGSGNDLVRGPFDFTHAIDGGPGQDTLWLGGYNSALDLSIVRNVERIESGDSGTLWLHWLTDAPRTPSHYTFVATSPPYTNPMVYTLNQVSLSPTVGANVSLDLISNEGTSLIFYKRNVGVDNVISFTGSIKPDALSISASDLRPNVTADGGHGADNYMVLTGGVATDASFTQIARFQALRSVGADVHLGAQAREMGLNHVFLDENIAGANSLVVDPAFGGALEVTISGEGHLRSDWAAIDWGSNLVDASQSAAAITVNAYAHELEISETIRGSSLATDVLNILYDLYNESSADGYTAVTLANVTGMETVNISFVTAYPHVPVASHGWIYIDTQASEIQAARQTITVVGVKGNPEDLLYAPIEASAATADLAISGANRVKSGSGNDTITALSNTRSIIDAGSGNDTVNGGNLVDVIAAGAGNDILFGGPGADQLDLGTGNDRVRYTALTNSAGTQSDAVLNFVSGSDVVDVLNLLGFAGKTIAFAGNAATRAAAQALLTPGDSTLDAVFQQDTHSLWFDNGDGVLDAFDLHIVLTGVVSLVGADVLHGSVVLA